MKAQPTPPQSPPASESEAESFSEDDELEFQLLDDADLDAGTIVEHDLATAPVFTRDAFTALGLNNQLTQYGVLGSVLSVFDNNTPQYVTDPRLYINTNAPFSALVCGVQGAGKSHTVSAILENMFFPDFSPVGSLKRALSGLVLHFGEGGSNALPNEAAFLATTISSHITGPAVKVYVSKSSLQTMRSVYSVLGDKVAVEPLLFHNSELDAEAILSMMAVGSSDSAPLYMQIILSILRDLGETFTFHTFLDQLELSKQKFNPAQLSGLEQRMSLLTSFLEPKIKGKKTTTMKPRFAAGQLTIVDLSDPFIDSASACGIFQIITRLFTRAKVGTGKVLVVDEAHKYLSNHRSSSGLTGALLGLIRQQRHMAMRVIISTQEPTVVPSVLIDLCSIVILHRFSSPAWWEHIIHHVSADFSKGDAFDQVVKLQTGQAIVLAPAGLGSFSQVEKEKGAISHFGRRYLIVKTRKRVTADGGSSRLVLQHP